MASAWPSDTWQVCERWCSTLRPFREHKATMSQLWVSRSLVEYTSTWVGGWPYNHGGHHVMTILCPVNSWNNSAAKKYCFSSTNSSLKGRSCVGSFTAALSCEGPLICNNLRWLCGSCNGECFCLCLLPWCHEIKGGVTDCSMLKASTLLPNFAWMGWHGQMILENGGQDETTQAGGLCGQ